MGSRRAGRSRTRGDALLFRHFCFFTVSVFTLTVPSRVFSPHHGFILNQFYVWFLFSLQRSNAHRFGFSEKVGVLWNFQLFPPVKQQTTVELTILSDPSEVKISIIFSATKFLFEKIEDRSVSSC